LRNCEFSVSQVAQDVPNYQQSPGLRRSNTDHTTTPNRAVVAQLVAYMVKDQDVTTNFQRPHCAVAHVQFCGD